MAGRGVYPGTTPARRGLVGAAYREASPVNGIIGAVSALEFVASLVSSIAWPAVVLVLGVILREQIKSVMAQLAKRFERLRKLKGGGFEAEFEDLKEKELEAVLQGSASGTYGWAGTAAGSAELPAEAKAEAEAEAEAEVEAEVEPAPESEYVQLDSKVRSDLIRARVNVQSHPRQAVVDAGFALSESVASTAASLDIPWIEEGKGAVSALLQAGVVDEIQADLLERLNRLYISALYDGADEITAISALEYTMLVEREIGALAVRRDAWLKKRKSQPGG